MLIELIRHGETALTAERRLQGATNARLSGQGKACLKRADSSPARVYVTPLRRTAETAAILFPDAEQIPVPGLSEMNFGVFDGREIRELEEDPDFRAWLDSMCLGPCPGGESKAAYCERVCRAFQTLLADARREGAEKLTVVAHGGTQMALLERFGEEARDYYRWQLPCGQGYLLEVEDPGNPRLKVLEIRSYTESTA